MQETNQKTLSYYGSTCACEEIDGRREVSPTYDYACAQLIVFVSSAKKKKEMDILQAQCLVVRRLSAQGTAGLFVRQQAFVPLTVLKINYF